MSTKMQAESEHLLFDKTKTRHPIDVVVNHSNRVFPDTESDDEYLEAVDWDLPKNQQSSVEGFSYGIERASSSPPITRHRFHQQNLEHDIDSDDPDGYTFCFPSFDDAKEHANQVVKKVWEAGWKVTHFHLLPEWLQDNEYLHKGHRPALPSVGACVRSIFRVHTETGNIWTHMLGCVAFIGVAAYFLTRTHDQIQIEDKLVFSAFFFGAIMCLGMSFAFHTFGCHSHGVGKIFSKLDYCGITTLIVGSFIPFLFYGFYCRFVPKIVYSILIVIVGIGGIVVSLWDKFATPAYRPIRAGMFVGLGLSGVIPAIHYLVTDGFWSAIYEASLGWILLMAVCYISGAMLYAMRIPERFFPGKCDIWFQSHQLFHMFVVVAAFIHYHGMSELAMYRLSSGSCDEQLLVPYTCDSSGCGANKPGRAL